MCRREIGNRVLTCLLDPALAALEDRSVQRAELERLQLGGGLLEVFIAWYLSLLDGWCDMDKLRIGGGGRHPKGAARSLGRGLVTHQLAGA